MCLPHDPVSLLRWMETQTAILGAWREDLAAVKPDARARLGDLDRCRAGLLRECARLRTDLGLHRACPVGRRAANDDCPAPRSAGPRSEIVAP